MFQSISGFSRIALCSLAIAIGSTQANSQVLSDGKIPILTELTAGSQALLSPSGRARLEMTPAGDLLLSWKTDEGYYAPVWNTETFVRGSKAVFQSDGNLIIVGPDKTPTFALNPGDIRPPVWTLQDDGNLILDGPNGTIWAVNPGDLRRGLLPHGATVFSKDRMGTAVKLSRNGVIELTFDAIIRKQSGTWNHCSMVMLDDIQGNTIWVCPILTLSLGAKVSATYPDVGRPLDHHESVFISHNIPLEIARRAAYVRNTMTQQEGKVDYEDGLKRLGNTVKEAGDLDEASKELKEGMAVHALTAGGV